MNRGWMEGVLVMALTLGSALPASAQPHRGAQADLEEALQSLDEALRVLEGMRGVRGRSVLMRQILEARDRVIDAMERLEYRGRRQPPGPPVAVPAGPLPMDPQRFAELVQDLRNRSFSSEQLDLLRDVARHQWFLTAQVRQVMQVFSFDSEKVEAAAILYPKVLDRENFYQAYADFTFDSDRQKLRQRVTEMDRTLPPGR